MQRIGIYSGAFDPVHLGHVAFACEAAEKAHLEKVFFLVEPQPRHKQGVKAFEHRVAMVKLAIADHSQLGLIVLDQGRFTVHETLPALHARFQGAQLAMLMGDDVFAHLSHWPRIDQLLSEVEFVVGVRQHHREVLNDHLETITHTKHIHIRYRTFEPTLSQYASSPIRRALRHGEIPDGLHSAVADYIKAEGLYSNDFDQI